MPEHAAWPFAVGPKPKPRAPVAPAEPFEPLACELAREVVRELAAQYCAAWREPTDEPLTEPRLFDVKFKGQESIISEAPNSAARNIAADPAAKIIFAKLAKALLEAQVADSFFFVCEGWCLHGEVADLENRNGRQIRDMPGRKECVFCLLYVRRGIYRFEQAFENGELLGELNTATPDDGDVHGYMAGEGLR